MFPAIARTANGAGPASGIYAGQAELSRSAEGPSPQLEIPAQLDGLSNTLHGVEELVGILLGRLQPAISNPPPTNAAAAGSGLTDAHCRNGCGLAGTIEAMRSRAQIIGEQLNYAITHLQF